MHWAQIIGALAVIAASVASALQSRTATAHAKQASAAASAASGWAQATHATLTRTGPPSAMAPQIPAPPAPVGGWPSPTAGGADAGPLQ